MSRIALIADTHGNAVAFDAVLTDLERMEPDEVVFLGDAAVNGPDPRGCIDRLRALHAHLVMGNTDADILRTPDFYSPPARDGFDEGTRRVLEISLWGHGQLEADDHAFIARFQPTVELDLDGFRLLCAHGSPRSATDVITATTPDIDLRQMGVEGTDLFAGGHTHVPLLRRLPDTLVVNPGSVGLPFAGYGRAGHVGLLDAAQYAVVDVAAASIDVWFRSVPLDVRAVIDAAHASGMPHADWWVAQWPDA